MEEMFSKKKLDVSRREECFKREIYPQKNPVKVRSNSCSILGRLGKLGNIEKV